MKLAPDAGNRPPIRGAAWAKRPVVMVELGPAGLRNIVNPVACLEM
jgi:hypothetical protein